MTATQPEGGTERHEWASGPRPRWFALYVALAAINVVTIAAGLYLSARTLDHYRMSLRESQRWDGRRERYAALAQAIADVDAPGNDVFSSHDVPLERARLDSVVRQYAIAMRGIRTDLVDSVPPDARAALAPHFQRIDSAMGPLKSGARNILAAVATRQLDEAGTHMAGMDRAFADINRELYGALRVVTERRRDNLQQQFRLADALYRDELWLSFAAIILACGIAMYGRVLARTFAASQAAREKQHSALQASEERYHLLAKELETRVKERTEDLARVTRELVRSDAHQRTLFGVISDVVMVLDGRGTFLKVLATRTQRRGDSIEDLVGRNLADLVPADVATYARKAIGEALATRGAIPIEYDLSLDGELVSFGGTVTYLSDDEVLWVARDITTVKAAERRLRESEAQLVHAQRIARVGSWNWDLGTNDLSWTAETYRQLGLDPASESPSFERYIAAVHPDDRPRVSALTQRSIESGEPIDFEARFLHADGSESHFRALGHAARGDDGQVVALTGTTQDVTEQKRINHALEEARAAADAASSAKSDFLATMSHEIRTPMNGVLGMLGLTLDTHLSADQRDHLEVAHSSAESLLTIINDILDFSKIEAGKLDLDPVQFDLTDALSDMMGALAFRAHRKDLELTLDVDESVPAVLVGDIGRLRQVIINLVGNAIKFTSQGEISVTVAMVSRQGDDVVLRIAVRDTGVGIPADKQALIFDAFAQADGSTTREYGGTGLGLAISSRLVTAMGGTLSVTSTPGNGSTFEFTTRVKVGTVIPDASRVRVASLRGLRVLAVDDSATNRRILEHCLLGWELAPTLAESGADALAAMREAIVAGAPHALVILDAHMPDMDGFALAEKLLADPLFSGVPIMMLSSSDQHGDTARCRALGISRYVTKPVKQPQLLEAILAAMGAAEVDAAPKRGRAAAARTTRPLTVLVAEDNAVNQKLAVSLLEKQGHRVSVVANGKLAVEALARETFDVVLMDVQMPVLGGLEATRQIRAAESERGAARTPIVALTARAMREDRERCAEAGMDGYVAKPIRPIDLFAEIDAVISARTPDAGVEHVAVPVGNEPVDLAALLVMIGGDHVLLGELAELFIADAPLRLEELTRAVCEGDAPAARMAAHALQGSAGNMKARPLHQAALELERVAESGNLDDAGELLDRVTLELSRALVVLGSSRTT